MIPRSIRGRLILLTISVLTPAMTVSALLLWSVESHARRGLERQLTETARAQLAVRLKQLRHPAPVLIISGYAEIDGLSAALPRLTKPFRQSELATALAALGARAGAEAR